MRRETFSRPFYGECEVFPCQSNFGSWYLNALVDSVVGLEMKNASLASFIPAVNGLTSDIFLGAKSKSEEIKLDWEN